MILYWIMTLSALGNICFGFLAIRAYAMYSRLRNECRSEHIQAELHREVHDIAIESNSLQIDQHEGQIYDLITYQKSHLSDVLAIQRRLSALEKAFARPD
jgi:hypothetical protein